MRTPEICKHKGDAKIRYGHRSHTVFLFAAIALVPSSFAQGQWASARFSVVASQFHQRDLDDAGETRICIQNTGAESLSMAKLKVRVLASGTDDSATECSCVYVKLSPPVLPAGQYGEIVAKLLDRPTRGCHLTGEISAPGAASPYEVALSEPLLWISYIGVSQDLRKVCVYVENTSQAQVKAELLRVGRFDVAGQTQAVHSPVPPNEKGCLVADLPSPLAPGGFVPMVIRQGLGGHESEAYAVARAVHAFPIVREVVEGDSRLGLDVHQAFLQTMICPAHAHGSHEEAAAKFLDDYAQRFSEAPDRTIQMAICRSDMPRAWFRFGGLPDAAAMNPCLRPPSRYEKNPQRWFCPFLYVGDLAKRATEPGRYVAIIPTGPDAEEGSLLLKGLAPEEWRFLVYCAVASGAKGVIYRGLPGPDLLNHDAFVQLNRELQHLKPLLLIAEPMEWVMTSHDNYAARSLLCGDQAVLIMTFDRRYFSQQRNGRFYTPPFGRAVMPVRLNVRIPPGMAVQDVRTPFASLGQDSWDYRNSALRLTAEMMGAVQVYIASLRWEAGPSNGGLPQ